MELESSPKFQTDSAHIVDNDKGENKLRSLFYKIKARLVKLSLNVVNNNISSLNLEHLYNILVMRYSAIIAMPITFPTYVYLA